MHYLRGWSNWCARLQLGARLRSLVISLQLNISYIRTFYLAHSDLNCKHHDEGRMHSHTSVHAGSLHLQQLSSPELQNSYCTIRHIPITSFESLLLDIQDCPPTHTTSSRFHISPFTTSDIALGTRLNALPARGHNRQCLTHHRSNLGILYYVPECAGSIT